jgi:hypothetical protein
MSSLEKPIVEWTRRVRAEYIEMPGLSLTRWQMRRMWLLDPQICDAVLERLVASSFLRRRSDNAYVREDGRF